MRLKVPICSLFYAFFFSTLLAQSGNIHEGKQANGSVMRNNMSFSYTQVSTASPLEIRCVINIENIGFKVQANVGDLSTNMRQRTTLILTDGTICPLIELHEEGKKRNETPKTVDHFIFDNMESNTLVLYFARKPGTAKPKKLLFSMYCPMWLKRPYVQITLDLPE